MTRSSNARWDYLSVGQSISEYAASMKIGEKLTSLAATVVSSLGLGSMMGKAGVNNSGLGSWADTLHSSAHALVRLKMHPWFELAHALSCMSVLRQLLIVKYNTDPRAYARRCPLACWVASMLICLGPSIFANLMVGESPLVAFKNGELLLLYTFVWYCSFYGPGDLIGRVSNFAPCRLCIMIAKEIYRCRRIYEGVSHALGAFQKQYTLVGIVATFKGAGDLLAAHCLAGPILGLTAKSIGERGLSPFVRPSFSLKSSIAVAVVFIACKSGYVDSVAGQHVPIHAVHLMTVFMLVYFRTSVTLMPQHADPFVPFERLIGFLLFGGMFGGENNGQYDQRETDPVLD